MYFFKKRIKVKSGKYQGTLAIGRIRNQDRPPFFSNRHKKKDLRICNGSKSLPR